MNPPCEYETCERPWTAKGLCAGHYEQRYRLGIELRPIKAQAPRTGDVCSFEGCELAHYGKGFCRDHWRQQYDGRQLKPLRPKRAASVAGKECSFEGCVKPVKHSALCSAHVTQRWRGHVLVPLRDGRRHQWTGKDGYVRVYRPEHPNAQKAGYVLEHILVMSEHLGRKIDTRGGENVHHKNGVRDDNALSNLELWSTSQPKGQRVEDKLAWARQFIEQYENEVPLLAVAAG